MGKIKKYSLALLLLLLTGCSLSADTWIYKELPNNYVIEKKSDTKMVIGKEIDGAVQIEQGESKIGFSEYVSEFQKGDRYVGFKCVKSADNGIDMLFYIIDTKESDVYGPYSIESTYDAVKEKIVDEEMSEWIKTSTIES